MRNLILAKPSLPVGSTDTKVAVPGISVAPPQEDVRAIVLAGSTSKSNAVEKSRRPPKASNLQKIPLKKRNRPARHQPPKSRPRNQTLPISHRRWRRPRPTPRATRLHRRSALQLRSRWMCPIKRNPRRPHLPSPLQMPSSQSRRQHRLPRVRNLQRRRRLPSARHRRDWKRQSEAADACRFCQAHTTASATTCGDAEWRALETSAQSFRQARS